MAKEKSRLVKTLAVAVGMAASIATTAPAVQLGGLAKNPTTSRPGQFMTTSRPTIAPIAFAKFCDNAADQCVRIGDRDTVELTKQKRTELQRINAEINTAIAYVSETAGEDEWKLNPVSGDCDDYAVTKRQRLCGPAGHRARCASPQPAPRTVSAMRFWLSARHRVIWCWTTAPMSSSRGKLSI